MAREYFYNQKPLKEYCKEKNLNYDKINSRIYRLSKHEVYKNESIDKIIFLSINPEFIQKKTPNKYMYNSVKLNDFCLSNDFNYVMIINYLNKLNKIYPQFSNQEIVNHIIEYFLIQKENNNNSSKNRLSNLKKLLENKLDDNNNSNKTGVNNEQSKLLQYKI